MESVKPKAISRELAEAPARAVGRPHTATTIVGDLMARHRIKVSKVAAALECSDRQVYNFLVGRRALTPLQVAALVKMFQVGAPELVDQRGFLLPSKG